MIGRRGGIRCGDVDNVDGDRDEKEKGGMRAKIRRQHRSMYDVECTYGTMCCRTDMMVVCRSLRQ